MRQRIMAMIGESGCYLLALLHIAEEIAGERIDAVQVYEQATAAGIMRPDCYINDPAELLHLMTGYRFTVRHAMPGELPASVDEWEILRFERQATGATYGHFVVGDGSGHIEYDPMGDSLTVKYGSLVSKRFIRRII